MKTGTRIRLPDVWRDHAHEVWPDIDYPTGLGTVVGVYDEDDGPQVWFTSDDDQGDWSWPAGEVMIYTVLDQLVEATA